MSDTPRTTALYQSVCHFTNEEQAVEALADLRDLAKELERENAALRGALKEFRDIAFIGMVAPVPDVLPYYSLVKKHSALLKNELKKEAQP